MSGWRFAAGRTATAVPYGVGSPYLVDLSGAPPSGPGPDFLWSADMARKLAGVYVTTLKSAPPGVVLQSGDLVAYAAAGTDALVLGLTQLPPGYMAGNPVLIGPVVADSGAAGGGQVPDGGPQPALPLAPDTTTQSRWSSVYSAGYSVGSTPAGAAQAPPPGPLVALEQQCYTAGHWDGSNGVPRRAIQLAGAEGPDPRRRHRSDDRGAGMLWLALGSYLGTVLHPGPGGGQVPPSGTFPGLVPGGAYELYGALPQPGQGYLGEPLDLCWDGQRAAPGAQFFLVADGGHGFGLAGPGGRAQQLAAARYPGQGPQVLGLSVWVAAMTRKGPVLLEASQVDRLLALAAIN